MQHVKACTDLFFIVHYYIRLSKRLTKKDKKIWLKKLFHLYYISILLDLFKYIYMCCVKEREREINDTYDSCTLM